MLQEPPRRPAPPNPIVQQIVSEIDAYMRQSGVRNVGWYVGITGDVDRRMFGFHQVNRTNGAWIYRRCPSESVARALEAEYHKAGCKGCTGGGSGDGSCTTLYAYAISLSTVE